jgi:arabinogalactan oligomer/maltooligosaccharide transport system substrate-binding protein
MERDSFDRRTALAGIGSMTAAVALSGCTGRIDGLLGGGSDSAALWHNFATKPVDGSGPSQTRTVTDQLDQYRQEMPEADVTVERIGGNYQQRLATGLPEGTGPEAFAWAHRTLGTYQGRELLYEGATTEPRLALDTTVDEAFLDVAADATRFRPFLGAAETRADEQRRYGLPYGAVTVGLVYNTAYVDAAPDTVTEWLDGMDTIEAEESGVDGLVCPGAPYHISAFARAFGGEYYDDDAGEVTFTSDAVVEGIEYYRERIWPHQPDRPGLNKQFKRFEKGNAAYAIATPREFSRLDEEVDTDLGVTSLPAFDSRDASLSPYVTVYLWYLTRLVEGNATKRTTTLDVLEWLTTTESAVATNAVEHGIVPVTSSLPSEVETDATMEAYYRSVESGAPSPSHPDRADVWPALQEALTRILTEDQDVRTALQEAASEIDT